MTYQEFLEYIYKRHSGNIKLGLERIESILQALGNPHRKLAGVHVAGTNGKGSTCAMLEALALQCSYSTGFNSSPHLVDYLERFRLNGKNSDRRQIMEIYLEHRQIFQDNEASFFETTTALAFELFARLQIEFNIFEVGLGGRLDGTNPFVPDVSVITSISLDHTKSLGDSLEKIAYEKAGIIKQGVPVVIGKMPAAALAIIEEVAAAKKARVYRCGHEFTVEDISLSSAGTTFVYNSPAGVRTSYTTNLLGSHQAYNAACALTAFILFEQKRNRSIEAAVLRRGLQSVHWQGRMQIVCQNPTVVLDGAHNEEGVNSLVESLQAIFPQRKKVFVVSILRDKNLRRMYAKIAGVAKSIIFCKNSNFRAADKKLQAEILAELTKDYYYERSVESALQKAREIAQNDDLIVVCGSLYWVGEVLKFFS